MNKLYKYILLIILGIILYHILLDINTFNIGGIGWKELKKGLEQPRNDNDYDYLFNDFMNVNDLNTRLINKDTNQYIIINNFPIVHTNVGLPFPYTGPHIYDYEGHTFNWLPTPEILDQPPSPIPPSEPVPATPETRSIWDRFWNCAVRM